MRILISGGLGFIGSHLTPTLSERGYEVTVFDRVRLSRPRYIRGDICDYLSLERCFDEVQPDVVVHLAAMVSRRECEETPSLAIQTNAEGTLNVANLCLKHGARLIYSGSSEEFGTALYGGAVVDEQTPFGEPTSIYSMTKRMAEEIIQYFSLFKGLTATTMRIFMLYGPGEEPSDYRSAIVRFIYWALKGEPLTVHRGTERSWCYIDDAVEAIKLIVERSQADPYEVFNIGKDDPISTEDLANKIREVCSCSPFKLNSPPSKLIMTDPEPTVIPVKRASFKKAKQVLGWEAKTALSYGLKQVAESLASLY